MKQKTKNYLESDKFLIRIVTIAIIFNSLIFSRDCSAQNPIVYYTFDNGTSMPIQPFSTSDPNIMSTPTGNQGISIVNAQPGSPTTPVAQTTIQSGGQVGQYLNFTNTPTASNISSVRSSIAGLTGNLNSFTVEFIVKFSAGFASQRSAKFFQFGTVIGEFTISDIYRIPDLSFLGNVGSGSLDLEILLDGIDRRTVAYYLDNEWHHFAFVVRPDAIGNLQQFIYVDGLCTSDFTFINSFNGPVTTLGNFVFNYGSASFDDFLGGMDELAIYDRYLTPTEVYQHYQDVKNGMHYTNGSSVYAPTIFSSVGILDPLEFPAGYELGSENYKTATRTLDQLNAYPVARFQPGHTLRRNVNYVRAMWMADIYNNNPIPFVSHPNKIDTAVSIQRELAQNWNYYYNFTENTSRFFNRLSNVNEHVNAAFINDILQPGNNFPLAGLLFRKQSNITIGVYPQCSNIITAGQDEQTMISCQNLEGPAPASAPCFYDANALYPRNSLTGLKLIPSASSPKGWSPLGIHRSIYRDDALTAIYNLDKFINSQGTGYSIGIARNRIELLAENNEIAPKYANEPMGNSLMDDDEIENEVNLAGGDVNDFQSNAKKNIDIDYRNDILNSTTLNLPATTLFFNYAVDGHDGTRYRYKHLRETNSMIGGHHYSTPDIYTTKPGRWHVDADADYHGWRWLAKARYKEQIHDGAPQPPNVFNDKRFAPFVSPGYLQRSELDMRPGQYLGLLKAIMLQGVDFFFAYAEQNNPNPAGNSFCWKIAPPVYAQAIGSRLEHFLQYGASLPGNMVVNVSNPGPEYSYWFNCGDNQKLVKVRQDYDDATITPLNRFAITGAMMRYSNAVGSAPINANATFELNGQNLTIPIRLQGSTYIYDYQDPLNVVFYQLDKWHQYEHPDHWSRDFEMEAEVFDNQTATPDWIIKSENINITGTDVDLTNVISYIHFDAIPANPIVYNFQPRKDGVSNNYTLWIRARSTSNSGLNITLTSSLGTLTNALNNVNTNVWTWYQVNTGTNYLNLNDDIVYSLSIIPQNTNIEIDAIKLTSPQYVPCPGTIDIEAGTMASSIAGFSYNGSILNLKGLFVVDHDFDFTNCTVYASPGAQISIMPGFELTVDGTTIQTCYKMWRGIKVQEGAIVTITNSTIRDAQFAVEADDGSIVNTFSNTFFTNNYIGIYASSNKDLKDIIGFNLNINYTTFNTVGTLKPAFPGQSWLEGTPVTGNKCYAGVYAYNAGSVSVSSKIQINKFHDLYNGIVLLNTSGYIDNTIFFNIQPSGLSTPLVYEGSAIISTGAEYYNLIQTGFGKYNFNDPPVFQNCFTGVFAQTGASISANRFEGISNAAIEVGGAVLRSVVIFDNDIKSNHNGIVLYENEGAREVLIYNNDISIGENAATAQTDNAGIVFANIEKSITSNLLISNNSIHLHHNYYAGIHLLNSGDAAVLENSIQQYNSSYPLLLNPAIKVDNSFSTDINCNIINDDLSITTIVDEKVAVEVNVSDESTIGCNSTNQTGDGFLFHGTNINTNFTGNNLHNHNIGLHLSASASIGKQPLLSGDNNRANEWIGSYTTWGAWNENSSAVNQSEFKYDLTDNGGASNTFFYPGTVSPTFNWFTYIPSTEDECSATIGCEALRQSCEGVFITDLDYVIANQFIAIAAEWPDETRWVAERNLYNKLLRCPELQVDLAEFFNRFAEYDSRRFFSELEQQLNQEYNYDSVNDSIIRENELLDEQLALRVDSLQRLMNTALEAGQDQLYKMLLFEMKGLQQQQLQVRLILEQVYAAIAEHRQLTAEELSADNLAQTFAEQYESNQQLLNEIFLAGLSGGLALTIEQIEILDVIANQCPYSGGPSVYQARAMLIKINGSKSYDDRQICYDNNIAWRKSSPEISNNISLFLKPNPAKEKVSVVYNLQDDKKGKLSILNIFGTEVLKVQLNYSSGQQTIELRNLANGVYTIRIIAERGTTVQDKLIITK